jgi:hypothetical protein
MGVRIETSSCFAPDVGTPKLIVPELRSLTACLHEED